MRQIKGKATRTSGNEFTCHHGGCTVEMVEWFEGVVARHLFNDHFMDRFGVEFTRFDGNEAEWVATEVPETHEDVLRKLRGITSQLEDIMVEQGLMPPSRKPKRN